MADGAWPGPARRCGAAHGQAGHGAARQSKGLSMILRPYQQEAIEAVYRHLRERDDNPAVVLPTGAGKGYLIAQLCADAVGRWGGRVLVLAHVK